MAKKSVLLEYLLAAAGEIKQPVGHSSVCASHFFVALVDLLNRQEAGEMPEQLQGEDVAEEWNAVKELLKGCSFDAKTVGDDILKIISQENYRLNMDVFLLNKIDFNMNWKGTEECVTAVAYLQAIIKEPTDALKKCIFGEESNGAEGEESFAEAFPTPSRKKTKPRPGSQALGSLLGTDVDGAETQEGESAQAEGEAGSGGKQLADIVRDTKSIRDTLQESVFGQDHAIDAVASGYFRARVEARAEKNAKKPQAVFLFAGPPGVGKTFLAEKTAEALKLPYRRFDMSEYADKEAIMDFCGTNESFKGSKPGNVTGFVAKHPRCVLLFDEIEKAHLNIIHLFLQMLDAGRLRDTCTEKTVSFTDAVIFFTTNAGKNLYDDPTVPNLSALPRKKVLDALGTDLNPLTGAPLFPAAICSRFASGNVVMFNRLEGSHLFSIADREVRSNARIFEKAMGIRFDIDRRISNAIMLAEGGDADARMIKGRAGAFFHDEIYELFRLLSNEESGGGADLTDIRIKVPVEELETEVAGLFENPERPEVLVFADDALAEACRKALGDRVLWHVAADMREAGELLFKYDISLVLCDVRCGQKGNAGKLLNLEDVTSAGRDFLNYALAKHSVPVYLLQSADKAVSREELLSFVKLGVKSAMTLGEDGEAFAQAVLTGCADSYRRNVMLKLARERKALTYRTAQTVSEDGKTAEISLFGFKLDLITGVEDSGNVLDNVSRPDVKFSDVIGAKDAKEELKYFVSYLRDPIKYMRKGVRSPKGVLLYGPPGTGKTLLAKAMAGESGVTFLRAEGNEFLKTHVGEGPAAVHAVFNAARKYAPSVLFIDEIDSIGQTRGTGTHSGGSDALTALLTEMDGFNTDTSRPVFVLAATNFDVEGQSAKSLDPALVRRFDRRIYVDLPDKEERKQYLHMKIGKYPTVKLSDDQVENIALRSTGMSLAELESVFEMALRGAIRSETGTVGDAEFEEAFETFNSGERKNWTDDSLLRTARHEAGHALVCWLSGEKPTYLTVVARGDHGGYMQHANSEGKGSYTKAELLARIRTSLAGRACETVYYGDEEGLSTGASGDLRSATRTAESIVCRYGMDETGYAYIDTDRMDGVTAQVVRERVNAILKAEMENAVQAISENRLAINAIVQALMEKNHLREDEINEIFTRAIARNNK